jgi:hypothetical protein
MMKDYNEILNRILDDEIRKQAELYFQKYWLDEDEYFEKWRPFQDAIFDSKAKHLPDMMFNVGFELFPMVGGDIFIAESDFTLLQDCMHRTGDEHFAIVQNRNVVVEAYSGENRYRMEPFTRFKYPVDISWAELMSGGIVGSEHLQNACKDYFVFGDSGNWGKYVANSWIQPSNLTGFNWLNIMGFKKQFSEIFIKNFEKVRQLEPEITTEILLSEWLPDPYKQLPGSLG